HAVGEQHALRPFAVLAPLLDAAVQVADDDVAVDDLLAVEPQHHAQHAVRARMLRAHVVHELVRVEHRAANGLCFHHRDLMALGARLLALGLERGISSRKAWSREPRAQNVKPEPGRGGSRAAPTRYPPLPWPAGASASRAGSPSAVRPALRADSPSAAGIPASPPASGSGAGRDGR